MGSCPSVDLGGDGEGFPPTPPPAGPPPGPPPAVPTAGVAAVAGSSAVLAARDGIEVTPGGDVVCFLQE